MRLLPKSRRRSLASALNDPAVAAAAGKGRGVGTPVVPTRDSGRRSCGPGHRGPRPLRNRASLKHRGAPITQATQPEAISRSASEAVPRSCAGVPVPEAELYRVTLFQADGRVLYEIEARDTSVVLPDSVRLMSGGSYLWKVEARTGWNRWSASRLFEFSVSAAP